MSLPKISVPNKVSLSNIKLVLKDLPCESYHSEALPVAVTLQQLELPPQIPTAYFEPLCPGPFQVTACRSWSFGKACNFPTLPFVYVCKGCFLPVALWPILLIWFTVLRFQASWHKSTVSELLKVAELSKGWLQAICRHKFSFPRSPLQCFLSFKFHIFIFPNGTMLQEMPQHDLIDNSPHVDVTQLIIDLLKM